MLFVLNVSFIPVNAKADCVYPQIFKLVDVNTVGVVGTDFIIEMLYAEPAPHEFVGVTETTPATFITIETTPVPCPENILLPVPVTAQLYDVPAVVTTEYVCNVSHWLMFLVPEIDVTTWGNPVNGFMVNETAVEIIPVDVFDVNEYNPGVNPVKTPFVFV